MRTSYGIIYHESGKIEEHDTFTCCHCSRICRVVRGSGTIRGFCRLCMAPTCGADRCFDCTPFERKLEAMEAKDRFRRMMERL